MRMVNYEDMTNEEMCVEYQKTRSEDLFNCFIKRNKPFIHVLMKEYGLSDKENEYIQIGRIAMWKAMLKFDITKGAKFTTYFNYIFHKELNDFRCIAHPYITLPRNVLSNISELKEKYPYYVYDIQSLDRSLEFHHEEDDDLKLIDTVPNEINIEEDIIKEAENKLILDILNTLPPKESLIISKYFGLNGKSKKTFEEIASEFKVSRQHIHQLYLRGMKKLKYKILNKI